MTCFSNRYSINCRGSCIYYENWGALDGCGVVSFYCIVFSLFSNANVVKKDLGINYWIPFTEAEIGSQDNIANHFMVEYLNNPHSNYQKFDLFTDQPEQEQTRAYRPIDYLSQEAENVMNAARNLWKYYHAQPGANPNASYYDIRLHFQGTKLTKSGKEQMNTESYDSVYTSLHNVLRESMRQLANHIEPKVYEYGFLK